MENQTTAIAFEHAAAMPAATWHFLKMNDATVEIPEGVAIVSRVNVDESWCARSARDEFEEALACAQEAWELDHPAPTCEEQAERAAYLAAEADATYGGTAQSAYQAQADAAEESRSLAAAFETGMGEEVSAYLRYAAGERIVVHADPGETVAAHVAVEGAPGELSVAAVDVVADEDSVIRLFLSVSSDGERAAMPDSPGFAGSTVRVFAGNGSRVEFVRTQALGDGCSDIDDIGVFVGQRARVEVRQTVLGADVAYAGLAADARGRSGSVAIDTRYLGRGAQARDFNFVVRHHGEKTESNIVANGVLAGTSAKTLRGTIDFVLGCKGAQGSENETVLLVDEGVRNKTVPTILCNEDDVAGNHGATIGHVRDEQLFYLASRGLSQADAESLFVGAIVEQAVLDASDDASREAVLAFGERAMPGFAQLFE